MSQPTMTLEGKAAWTNVLSLQGIAERYEDQVNYQKFFTADKAARDALEAFRADHPTDYAIAYPPNDTSYEIRPGSHYNRALRGED